MRTCNNCGQEIMLSAYTGKDTARLGEGLGLSLTIFIDGHTDVCRTCLDDAAHKAIIEARKCLSGLILDEKTEGSK